MGEMAVFQTAFRYAMVQEFPHGKRERFIVLFLSWLPTYYFRDQ
jgi:hypothetical protein